MSQTRKFILATAAVLVLCLCFGVGGYLVGRQAALAVREQPAPAVIELAEVTVEAAQPPDATSAEEPATQEPALEPVEQEPPLEPADVEPRAEEPAAQEPTQEPATQEPAPAQEPATQEPATNEPVVLSEADLAYLNEVWNLVNQQYDGRLPDKEEVLYAAVIGSLALLEDDFTRFYTPEVAAGFRESLQGSYEGVGAIVDINEDGYLVMVRVFAGGPGDGAGLLSGDVVTHVNGRPIQGLLLEEIIAQVKGPRGTPVTLTILREAAAESFDLTVIRDVVEIPIVEARMLDNGIAYVSLSSFSSNARQQLEAALVELLAQNPQGLIFDLRDNTGGFLNQSVAVADLFLPEGVILYERDRFGQEETFLSVDGDIAEEIPLVVLVNAQSASASEIVAGAIQDRDRAVLIGEITYGKGSVQQTNVLSDEAELRVTIARWYTPNNQSINGQGITPDIEIEPPTEYLTEADGQLQRAIEFLLTGE
jgi:carboxyl-terminal processing protease